MADAIAESSENGVPVIEALNRAAAERGRAMGASAIAIEGSPRSRRRALELACSVLAEHGYEPREEDDRVLLANCPFHALAATHTEMVCGMNLALIDAMVETMDAVGLESQLDPGEGRCCVVLAARRKSPLQS